MKKILIFVEGETEKKLVNSLGVVGKIQIVNLWEQPIKKIIPRIKEELVIIIFDTDILSKIDFFKQNLQILRKNKIKFQLIQQTNNLEGEILRCSNCNKIQDVFNTQGIREFKSQWLKCQNLDKKLSDIGFQPNQLWTGKLISTLHPWHVDCKNFKDLQLKSNSLYQ